ncbi:MAG: NAD(P)H-hydrate epimerase [Endomicrobiia bacterium]
MKNKPVSVNQMRKIDRHSIEKIGIPSIVLMDNAGRLVAETILKKFPQVRKIAVFCGGGNNAGDGFVTARYLFRKNKSVEVFMLKKPDELSSDARINYEIVKKLKIKYRNVFLKNLKNIKNRLKNYDLLVDALLGTGTKGKIRGIYSDVISLMNDSGKPIVAIDIPSGLDADKGLPLGNCIKAKITVTMGFMKKGFLKKGAKEFTGKIVVADIGLI